MPIMSNKLFCRITIVLCFHPSLFMAPMSARDVNYFKILGMALPK